MSKFMSAYPDVDKTLTQEGMPADAKAVSERLDEKANANTSVHSISVLGGQSYMASIDNTAQNRTGTITLTNVEQFVFVVGVGASGVSVMSIIGGSKVQEFHASASFEVTAKNGNIITVKFPDWFKGFAISYIPFSVNI